MTIIIVNTVRQIEQVLSPVSSMVWSMTNRNWFAVNGKCLHMIEKDGDIYVKKPTPPRALESLIMMLIRMKIGRGNRYLI